MPSARICALALLSAFAAPLAFGAPPPNDNFAGRITIAPAGGDVLGTNVDATFETGEPSHADKPGGKSVWWTWTPAQDGSYVIDTIGSNFDTLLAVYTGTAVGELTEIASNDDSGLDSQSIVAFVASGGTAYQIAVDGWNGEEGPIFLTVAVAGEPPANDDFFGATEFPPAGGTLFGTSANATREPDEPNHADKEGLRSVWWEWTAPAGGNVTIETTGSAF
ncbi:MAG TPA: hypothetical protein VMM36_13070, partial [Opitutaceae bacterium]|nr:hypothetical protein [Opitutaceae bacterium]